MTMSFRLLGWVAAWAFVVTGCGAPPPAKPRPATPVVAKPAARQSVISGVALTGTVEPEQVARLFAQVEGEVELLAVREGDAVRAGAVLLRIDPSRLQAALDEARGEEMAVQADLDDARRVLERDRVLFDRQGIGKERLEGSETAVRRLEAGVIRAQARLAGLAAQLADTEVRAPFDGYVLERHVELGDVVKSGSPLLALASHAAHILVQVSAVDLGRLNPGDEVKLAVDSSGSELLAKVSRIRPQVDPATRTAAVEVVPAAGGARLLPGMLVQATFTLGRREDVLAVPAEAVLTRPDGSRALFVVDGKVAVQRSVTTGLEGNGRVEVLDGLSEGELVVLQGQERLKDGAPVALKGMGGAATGQTDAPAGGHSQGPGQASTPSGENREGAS